MFPTSWSVEDLPIFFLALESRASTANFFAVCRTAHRAVLLMLRWPIDMKKCFASGADGKASGDSRLTDTIFTIFALINCVTTRGNLSFAHIACRYEVDRKVCDDERLVEPYPRRVLSSWLWDWIEKCLVLSSPLFKLRRVARSWGWDLIA